MGKLKVIWVPIIAVVLFIGWLLPSNGDSTPTPEPTNTAQPTKTPLPEPTTTKTPTPTPKPKPVVLNYWPNGLKVDDVTDQTSNSCTFDMCIFLKFKAAKTCSKITVDGTVYTADDEEIDSFSEDYGKLAKGKSRTVEFGTDAVEDIEDYVDYDDVTCWK